MGIRGLYRYMRNLPGSCKEVNIIEEVNKYKQVNGSNPAIVINLWTLHFHYKSNLHAKLLGHRLNEIQQEFENFLKELQNNQVKMIFLFKKSQHLEHEFIMNQEERYRSSCEILDVISTGQTIEAVATHFEAISNFNYSFNEPLLITLTQTAKKYGKFYGIDSIDNKPATFHVQIANQHNAMAIMGTDTYYVFYAGKWKFWADMTLDIKRMTICEYDKEFILRSLNITVQQAPLFVALVGELYTNNEEDNMKLVSFFRPFYNIFMNVSRYVNSQRFPIQENTLDQIVAEIFGSHRASIIDDFHRTFDLMIPKSNVDYCEDENFMTRCSNDYINFADLILTNTPIYISSLFVEFRSIDMPPLGNLVSPWIQKTAGILVKAFPNMLKHVKIVKIFVKERHLEKSSIKKLEAVSPNANLNERDEMQLLIWISGTEIPEATLRSIARDRLADFIILAHLIKTNSLRIFEAKLILQTIFDVENDKVPADAVYPKKVSERALRVSFLYSKLYFIFHSCLSSIGLNFQTLFRFDNVYFQNLYESEDKKDAFSPNDTEAIVSSFTDIVNHS